MAKQYMFVAGGDACGACAGLDGTITDGGLGPQHDNCHCQDVPVAKKEDCPTLEVPDVSIQRTGPTSTVGADVTVHCCDGTDIGMSVEQDLGPVSLPIDQILDQILDEFRDLVESEAADLAGQCPEGIPVWVEDGEEEGLA